MDMANYLLAWLGLSAKLKVKEGQGGILTLY